MALLSVVINSIPDPGGMTETPRTGHQNGTELTASRTAWHPGRFRSFRTILVVPDGIVLAVNLGTGQIREYNLSPSFGLGGN
jgi:hypothetical protein